MREYGSFSFEDALAEADARQKKIREEERRKASLLEQKKKAARESLRVANEWYSQRILEPAAEAYAKFCERNIPPELLARIPGEEGLFSKKPDTLTYGWLINRTSNPQKVKDGKPPAGRMVFLLSNGDLWTLQYKFDQVSLHYGSDYSWEPRTLQSLDGAHIFAYSEEQSKVALGNTFKRMAEIAATGQHGLLNELSRSHDEQVAGDYPTFPINFSKYKNKWLDSSPRSAFWSCPY